MGYVNKEYIKAQFDNFSKRIASVFLKKTDVKTVATSGSYNDLSNKPTIPTVGDGTITIKQNGTSKGTFTTNQSGNTTIELTDNNTTYSNFVKSGSGAKAGLVPAPSTTAGTTKYLREDGTWTAPPNTNTDTKVTNTLAATTKAYVTGTISAATNTGTQVFDTDVYLDTTAGQLTAKTFKGDLSGNADTATQLATARTIQTNLESTSSASFNGSANVTPGITGTLPVSHGGTGATTLTSGAALIGNGTGAVTTRAITNNKSKGASGWTSANGDNLITANTLAYWDGAYTGTSSNLARCSKGAFGSIVTKNADDYATASHSHDLSTMINGLSTGTSAPKDADYYVAQYAGGGTTNTTYLRRPVSSLWTYIKSKLATVATSGSYNDLKNKPTALSTLEQVTTAVEAGNLTSPVGAGALAEVNDSVAGLKTVSIPTDYRIGEFHQTSIENDKDYLGVGLLHENGIFVVCGNDNLYRSEDGITWTAIDKFPANTSEMIYDGERFITSSYRGQIRGSYDAITWEQLFTSTDNTTLFSGDYTVFTGIACNNAGTYVVADASNNRLIYNTTDISDPSAWSVCSMPVTSPETLKLKYLNGKFFAMVQTSSSGAITGTYILYSEDGITWSIALADTINCTQFCDIAYGNGLYVATSIGINDPVYYSRNGIGWYEGSVIDNSYGIQFITYINDSFYAASQNGYIYRSENAMTWEKVYNTSLGYSGEGLPYNMICGNDKVVLAYGTTIYYADGHLNHENKLSEELIKDLYKSTGEGKIKFRVNGAGRLEYSVYTE